jgi:hypothetical protein
MYLWDWIGTESTITVANYWSIAAAMDHGDDDDDDDDSGGKGK